MNHRLPNFLLVGAPKCGTTSLHRYLTQHPEVFMSEKKEPMFLISELYTRLSRNDPRCGIADNLVVRTLEGYEALFESASTEVKALGEGSVAYLYHHNTAIPNIKKYLGEAKIIIVLRDPVERAYSSYNHLVRDGVEPLSFEAFLREEEKRKLENWDVLNFPFSVGLYSEQVEAYQDSFAEVLVLRFDDLVNEPKAVCQRVFEFLEVDDSFVADTHFKLNGSGEVRSQLIKRLMASNGVCKNVLKSVLNPIIPKAAMMSLARKVRQKNVHKERIKDETRRILRGRYAADMARLQMLVNLDISDWHR